jgi:hypothetical protein
MAKHAKSLDTELDLLYQRAGRPQRGGAGSTLILRSGGTDPCRPVEVVETCAAGHKVTRTYACTRRKCSNQTCTDHALRDRQQLLKPLMQELFPREWGVLVLSYAPEVRDRLRWRVLLQGARQLAAARFESIILDMNGLNVEHGWRLGIVSIDHPCGDRCQACSDASRGGRKVECPQEHAGAPGRKEWKPHHNFLFPCVAFGPNGARRRIRYSFTKDEIAELRYAWQEVQEVTLEAPLGREANLHYQFRREPAKKAHSIRYFPRTFPEWSARGQQLSYMGVFGCSVIKQLPEVMHLKCTVKAAKAELHRCTQCKKEIIERTCNGSAVPLHYRAVFGGSSQ